MLSPSSKKSTTPPPFNVTGNLCRQQRRKLARRNKALGHSAADLLVKLKTDLSVRNNDQPTLNHELPLERLGREMFLQSIVEACASNVAVLDERGNILYVSKPWRLAAERHGSQAGRRPLDLNCLARRTGPHAELSNHTSALVEDIQAILNGTITEFHNEYSSPGASGSNWFVVHAARLNLPGTAGAFRILVNSSDITHARQAEETLRDLGGRLITAQEEERSRVARELHDDLNQRMALLLVELEQLSQRVPAGQKNLRLSINNVCERAQEISTEIHRVSYQLHPSKLDHLGLGAAVKSHCLELVALHEIKIDFKEVGGNGVLPKDVTLCLFRIVQESFRNVIKHSGAREASVVLEHTPRTIHLSVTDTGRGFDAEALESKGGLGLISMRERLRLVGGLISIHSTARGTKVEVSVPLNGADVGSSELPVL